MELIYIKDLSKAYGKTRVLDHLFRFLRIRENLRTNRKNGTGGNYHSSIALWE